MKLRRILPKRVEGHTSMCLADGTSYEQVGSRISRSALGALEVLVHETRRSRSALIEDAVLEYVRKRGFIASTVLEDRDRRRHL